MGALSTANIEKQIAGYTLQFDTLKDDEVEWCYQPPAFIPAFVELVERLQRIPLQAEYAEVLHREESRSGIDTRFLLRYNARSRTIVQLGLCHCEARPLRC
jgi:hypothetical protein